MAGRGMRKKKRDAHGLPLPAAPTGIDIIPKPPHVLADSTANAVFDAVVRHLAERGDLRPSFELPLALLASEWSRYVTASAIAAKEPVTEGSRGLRANPACAVAAAAARTVQGLCMEFGLTSASLSRLDLPAAAPQGMGVIASFQLRRKTSVDLDDPDVAGLDRFFLEHGTEDQRRDAVAAVLQARRSGR
jgi:phage terminase small subunit